MFPLKSNFFGGLPLASLSAGWLRTVANILNDIEGIGCHIEKTYGGEGMGWKIVVDTDPADLEYPFKVTDNGGGSVDIKGGSWTRNGITVTLADTTLSSVGADNYVFIYLGRDTITGPDPALIPNTLSVVNTSSLPADGLATSVGGYNIIFVLGKFTAGVWEQYWKGGHIDDLVLRPDSDHFNSTGRSTIVQNPESGANQGELQVGDVHSVKASALSIPFFASDDSTPKQGAISWAALDAHEGVTPTHSSLEIVGTVTGTAYAQIVGFRTPATPTDPFATDAYTHHFGMRETNGTLTAMKWYDFDTFVSGLKANITADLTFLEDLGDVLGGYIDWDSDWNSSVTHTGMDFSGSTSAKGTGLSGGNTDHDDSYWHEAGLIASPFTDTKNYVTSGTVRAGEFQLETDSPYNLWSNIKFAVRVSGNVEFSGLTTGEFYLGGDSGDSFINIYFNGVAGIDIANWTTKGGLTGANIIEVEGWDVRPTDKVLVIRA
jgi:hypothetical protein